MSTFKLGAMQVYNHALETLGAVGLSPAGQTACQQAIQGGLSHILHYYPWSWRKRRWDLELTASTPYDVCPSSFESMACAEICRTDSVDGVVRTLLPRTDRDFWRAVNPTDVTGTPTWYRIAERLVGSTNCYVVEAAPYADGDYTWPDVEYFCSDPELSFTGSTGTVPEMPTEFFDLWQTAAEWKMSRVLRRHRLSRQLKADLEEALTDAVKRHDDMFPMGPPLGLEDPYNDAGAAGL